MAEHFGFARHPSPALGRLGMIANHYWIARGNTTANFRFLKKFRGKVFCASANGGVRSKTGERLNILRQESKDALESKNRTLPQT